MPVDEMDQAALDLDHDDPVTGPQDDEASLAVTGSIGEALMGEDHGVVGWLLTQLLGEICARRRRHTTLRRGWAARARRYPSFEYPSPRPRFSLHLREDPSRLRGTLKR